MRFNSNTNSLSLLSENTEPVFSSADGGPDVRLAARFIHFEFTQMRAQFRSNIQYVCESFYNSYLKGREKLSEIIFTEAIAQSGTFIRPLPGTGTSTTFYSVETAITADGWSVNCVILMFNKTKEMAEPYLIAYLNTTNGLHEGYVNKNVAPAEKAMELITAEVLSLIFFTKYCDLETKMVPAGKKQIRTGEKYLNETALPIEILDSSWFTSIVRSEGFTVGGETGGFFRLQPYGPGRSEKKLIWITAFEKSGYARKAKVLLPKDG